MPISTETTRVSKANNEIQLEPIIPKRAFKAPLTSIVRGRPKKTVMSVTAVGMNYLRVIAYLGYLELSTAVTATPGGPKHRGGP